MSAIWYTGERWEWRPVSELRLPIGVSDLISRRLSRLSPRAQGILTTAAVIGREFDIDLAIEAGAGTEEELLDAIDEGVRASVLQSSPERDGDRYTWAHGKMADALRDSSIRALKRNTSASPRRCATTPDNVAEIATHSIAAVTRRTPTSSSPGTARRSCTRTRKASSFSPAERNASSPTSFDGACRPRGDRGLSAVR